LRLQATKIDGNLNIAADCNLICISGGDGALRLVVASLYKQKISVPICVFPAGTVNLIARELGYSPDPDRFASEVMAGYLGGKASRLREALAVYDGSPFVACLSAGPDGFAVANHSPKWKKRIGGLAYGLSLLKLLLNWPRHQYSLAVTDADGNETALSCEALYIIKGHYFGGNWSLAPHIYLGSEQFHLLTLRSASRWHYTQFLARIAMGRDPAKLGFVQSCDGVNLTVEQRGSHGGAQAFQIDGDPMSKTPSTVEMTDHIIEYCLPRAD
jgi:diacylglycerol kinase family enzyme